MPLDRHKTVRQALMYVTRHPEWPDVSQIERVDMEIWELVARQLYDIANYPKPKVRGSVALAIRAQKIILNRLTGTRRQGTHPAVRRANQVTLTDLTIPSLEQPEKDDGA